MLLLPRDFLEALNSLQPSGGSWNPESQNGSAVVAPGAVRCGCSRLSGGLGLRLSLPFSVMEDPRGSLRSSASTSPHALPYSPTPVGLSLWKNMVCTVTQRGKSDSLTSQGR